MTAVVLAAGRVVATAALRRLVADAQLVVAADGGARHARVLALEPDVIVGDHDSLDAATLRRHPNATCVRHPSDKDLLDLELALDVVAARGATRVLVVGAFGGRVDHQTAVLLVASARHRDGFELELHGGDALALPLAAGQRRPLELPPGTVVSVLATALATRVTLEGLRYPLRSSPLETGSGLGMSNVVEGQATVEVHAGAVLVLVPNLPGVEAAEVIWGRHEARIDAGLRALDPVLGDLVRRVAYDEVFGDPALDLRTRELLALAHLVGLGGDHELHTHLNGALRAGATPSELRALLAHAAMFVGFPRALAGAKALREVLDPTAPT